MKTVVAKNLDELAKMLGAEAERQSEEIKIATLGGVLKSIPMLVQESPVDTGQYANSWDVIATEELITLGNFAPHAAIIEFGARPFIPPIKPLLEWAKRVLGDASQPPDYSPRVRALAYYTRNKIQQEGMQPKRVLTNAIPDILKNIRQEFRRIE
jgi:hypothetical protein